MLKRLSDDNLGDYSALSIHNEDEPLSQFAHFMTGKIRNWDIKSVILTLEEEMSDETVAHLSQCVDRKLDLSD